MRMLYSNDCKIEVVIIHIHELVNDSGGTYLIVDRGIDHEG